jgi:hypothetical protein
MKRGTPDFRTSLWDAPRRLRNSNHFREYRQTTDKCRGDGLRKLIRISARGPANRILIRFGGIRPEPVRAYKTP